VDHVLDLRTTIKAVEDGGRRRITGIATTPDVDRMGDVVLPAGAKFQLPIPLLWQHDPTYPVGNVVSAKVTSEGIEVEAEFAPEGTLNAIDNHWAELKAGLVRFFSIGFRALKTQPGKTGLIFSEWEWLELSAVTIPANAAAAITAVKAYAVPGRDPSASNHKHAGTAAHPTGHTKMTIAEKIAARKAALQANRAQLAAELDADVIDEQRSAEIERLNAEIETDQRELEALERSERNMSASAVAPVTPRQVSGTVVPAGVRPSSIIVRAQPKPVQGDLIFKTAAAMVLAHVTRTPLGNVLRERYAGNNELEHYIRAVSAPADTVTPGWAAELVAQTTADFIDSLQRDSLYAALTARGIRFTFGRSGKVVVPGRGTTGDLAGDWIGEGAPIPVKQGNITGVTLSPHKLAVISTFTRELAAHSTPQIEALIRQMILEDTANALDKFLFDNVAAGSTRPAGLLNGVTLTPSAGSTNAQIVTDLKTLLTAITSAGGGRRLAFVMNPVHAVGLGMVQSASGDFTYQAEIQGGNLLGITLITSLNMPVGTVILMDLADFASATGDQPTYDVSDVATLHMESSPTAVAPIVAGDGTAAAPVRSLWQTASIGVRMIQDVSWGMRRPGMIAGLSGVAW